MHTFNQKKKGEHMLIATHNISQVNGKQSAIAIHLLLSYLFINGGLEQYILKILRVVPPPDPFFFFK